MGLGALGRGRHFQSIVAVDIDSAYLKTRVLSPKPLCFLDLIWIGPMMKPLRIEVHKSCRRLARRARERKGARVEKKISSTSMLRWYHGGRLARGSLSSGRGKKVHTAKPGATKVQCALRQMYAFAHQWSDV